MQKVITLPHPPSYYTDKEPYVLRAQAHAWRHPPSSMCFTCRTGRGVEREQKKVGREVDKEKKYGWWWWWGGALSEACVRAIPCWCQFHSSSSMLRSFYLPRRENTHQLALRECGREVGVGGGGGQIRVIEVIGREASGAGTGGDRKTEAE